MSLFLKIFVWFWLAMALIVGAVFATYLLTRSVPLREQFRSFMEEEIEQNSQTAVQIYENEGKSGLTEFFNRELRRNRVVGIGLFDQNEILIAGNIGPQNLRNIFRRTQASHGRAQYSKLHDMTFGAKRLSSPSGNVYYFALEISRFDVPPIAMRTLVVAGLLVVLIVTLVCWLLAGIIVRPILRLRTATEEFAAGNLNARIGRIPERGGDELTELSREFNKMAARIETLINSEKRLTQDISHELRSPLARMSIAIELARKTANEKTLPQISRIELENWRLNELVKRLLTLSKLETGSGDFEKHELNLATITAQAVEDAEYEARAMDKYVKMTAVDSVTIKGNAWLVKSAIENVLRNAVRYTAVGSMVKVNISKRDKSAIVSIEDEGGGVPEAELASIFKPFYRVQEARERKTGGMGIGLAIASRAVENHNGKIEATNSGKGLRVELTFPLIDSA